MTGQIEADVVASAEAIAFAALKKAIIARTGHAYYADKDHLLKERLRRRQDATGVADGAAYQALLAAPRLGEAEWCELESEITIGETSFFRHEEQIAALSSVILPRMIEEARPRRRLRIWSAGCANGAEPYTLAILLERLLGRSRSSWSVDILGTDISSRALAQARVGLFGEWALRGLPQDKRRRDFHRLGPHRWEIDARHRQGVRFERHNLLDLQSPGGAGLLRDFDLILCRNVLIYFAPDQVVASLRALTRCLGPDGWLLVGHSDAMAALPTDLVSVTLPGTLAFRAAPAGRTPLVARGARPQADLAGRAEPAGDAAPEPGAPQPAAPQSQPEPATPPPAAPQPGTFLPLVQALADSGHLAAAAEAVAAGLRRDRLDARLHFYDGVIARGLGRAEAAEAALRRAIYLSGTMVMAHYHLGLLLASAGRVAEAERAFVQVRRLCAGLPPHAPLPDSDALTPQALLERLPRPGRVDAAGGGCDVH